MDGDKEETKLVDGSGIDSDFRGASGGGEPGQGFQGSLLEWIECTGGTEVAPPEVEEGFRDYLIVGRVPEDDDDTALVFQARSIEEAEARFCDALLQAINDEKVAQLKRAYSTETGCLFTAVFSAPAGTMRQEFLR